MSRLSLLIILLICFTLKTNAQLLPYTIIGQFVSYVVDLTSMQSYFFSRYPDSEVEKEENVYDFVIVGSGPSGSALANRLTENPDVKVLLLESCGEASFITDIPLAAGALEFSRYNYGFKSEPQPGFCRGCPNKTLQWPHGNVLGGTSVINYMIYVRGNPGDYDKWEAEGNPGWSYRDLLPFFKKLEDAQVEVQDAEYRGPLTVSDVLYRTKIAHVYVNACMEAGHRYVDYNGKNQLGVTPLIKVYLAINLRKNGIYRFTELFLAVAFIWKVLAMQVFKKIRALNLICLVLIMPYVNGIPELYQIVGDVISYAIEFTRIQTFFLPLYPPRNRPKEEQYDFIIVGSGPSGSALANRLTENPNINVLLLENGGEASIITDIPIIAGALEFTSYNYNYKSQPQPGFCRACPNGRLEWPHGNVLGGSSIINYMIYVRGNPGDYDKWAAMGNPGWSYKDMLPYFIKLEDANVKRSDKEIRGKGGYVSVSDVPWRSKIADVYVNACMEAGHEYVDYNGRRQLGVSYIQATLRNGARCSAEKAYLRPARKRKNLKIQVSSKVTKILMDEKNKTTYGVEYYYKGKKHIVHAKKEVICSAGALNSPQILMLSGIGPKEHLEQLGIPVIKDLPVGKKMYDHATFPVILFEVSKPIVINAVSAALNPFNYIGILFGNGLFTSIGGVEAITYVKTNISTDSDPLYPDVELQMVGGALNTDFGIIFRKIFNIPPKIYNKVFLLLIGKYVYMVTPTLLHPKSYGWIKLKSKDPWEAPLFYPNFFSDPENHDIKTLIASFRELERINSMPAFKKVGARLVTIPIPGCEQHEFDSDDYWECALRSIIGSYYHQVATCKMGPQSDPEAVVDHKLRVHGIKKLRVVDTSVIPLPPATHNVGPAYAIGEKAADLIKELYQI